MQMVLLLLLFPRVLWALMDYFFYPASVSLSVRPSVRPAVTLFRHTFKFSNNFYSSQRIELKLLTNVYINMSDGFTKGV